MHKRIFYTFFVTVFTIKAMEIPQFTDEDYATYCALRHISKIYKILSNDPIFDETKSCLRCLTKLNLEYSSKFCSSNYVKSDGIIAHKHSSSYLPWAVITKWGAWNLFELELIINQPTLPMPDKIFSIDQIIFAHTNCAREKIVKVGSISLPDIDTEIELIKYSDLSIQEIEKRKKQWTVLSKRYKFDHSTLKTRCLEFIKSNQKKHSFDLNKLPDELKAELNTQDL